MGAARCSPGRPRILSTETPPDYVQISSGHLRLPDRDGWVVLDRLEHDPRTRHMPVHIISVEDEERRGLEQGAMAYLHKPVTKDGVDAALSRIKSLVERPVEKLLVVEDNDVQRQTTVALIAADSHGSGVLALVLTGSNRDGAAGARYVKEHGGSVFVEDPKTAHSPSMPAGAIAATPVDAVLPLPALCERLIAACR